MIQNLETLGISGTLYPYEPLLSYLRWPKLSTHSDKVLRLYQRRNIIMSVHVWVLKLYQHRLGH
jgi:hypothetical protein